ncbi:hypothetical protein H2200_005411 [Cladophialophora chaetospira]|uniref:Major facilitator superfamily (MFS) profile domain-containing protein n=1 Tax=Cladophialophora chaetospira TaxID=386627 RepID=A0AA39CIW7_9EURO|nr:hypothetical protein H2200_005411 [Cladophialophora chaetospira]
MHQLHANAAQYSWIGSSYALASTASTPLWAKCSDVWGRTPLLLLANGVFMAGSLLSGLSKTIDMLIAGRTIQGLGGGGILILSTIIMADLFTLRDRAKYYSLSAIVWAVSSGLGPILGGVFTQTIGWRWCFFINLPFDGASLLLLTFTLRLKRPETTVVEGLKAFDWFGSVTIVGGTICFLCGLEGGASTLHGWKSAYSIGLMVGGVTLFLIFATYEWRWAAFPLVPMRALSSRPNLAAVFTAIFHGFVFIAYDFFLPLYFQVVLGASPIHSGLYLFALVLPLSAVSFATGQFVRRTGNYHIAAWFGSAVMTLGTGLFINFGNKTVWWKIIVYQMIAGVGAGPLFLSPMLGLQDHLPQEHVASGTSAMSFLRSISTASSIVIGGVVLQNAGLKGGNLTAPTSHDTTRQDLPGAGTSGYTAALSKMWMFYTAFCGLMVVSALFITKKSPARSVSDGGDAAVEYPETEKQRGTKEEEAKSAA